MYIILNYLIKSSNHIQQPVCAALIVLLPGHSEILITLKSNN
jgi:hypothetical protein